MRPNTDELKVHFINVNHGDATILEFPDYGSPLKAHFGVVDFGAKLREDRGLITAYMEALIDLRRRDHGPPEDYAIDFACVTHPHDDHFGGLRHFMDTFTNPQDSDKNKVVAFWDCGFRVNALRYNKILRDLLYRNVRFSRLGAGTEFELGPVRISVLAPSVDLRNRFDTYGVGKNDASVVLKVKYRNSYVILAGDAEFASWGKTTEEFPRRERISFHDDALGLSKRGETADQLKCDLLRLSHHGSKHGTSLEYLERLKPNRIVISCGSDEWYQEHKPEWAGKFPHELTQKTLDALTESLSLNVQIFRTGCDGNLIFKYSGDWTPRDPVSIRERPGDPGFQKALADNWK